LQVERHAAAQGDLRCVAVCRYALGSMAFLRGAFPEPAQEHLEQALRLQERIGSAAGMAYTLARWAVMLTAQGNLEAAWERVQQGFRAAERASVRDHCLQRLHGAGLWNRVEAGDLEEAARLAAAVEQMEKAGPLCPACGLQLHPALAAYHLARRDLDAAKQRSERALEMAAASLNRGARALALRLQGEIAAARGDAAGAVSLLDEAAVQFAELGMRPDLERTRAIRARVA
jgi:tetratricopeptide (TPR) repeat protein